jgi:hypothetical protein
VTGHLLTHRRSRTFADALADEEDVIGSLRSLVGA